MASASVTPDTPPLIAFLMHYRVRLTILIFALALGTEFALGWKPVSPLDLSQPWIMVGTIAVITGLLIRSWAAGAIVKREELASDGPYAFIRHPLYLGSILLMLGFTLLTGLWINLLVAGLLAAISFGAAICCEEAYLAKKFGDHWHSYAAARGRLIPRGIAGSKVFSWDGQRWLTNTEFNAWLGAAIGWMGILAWSWC